jgi:hypothetical protein
MATDKQVRERRQQVWVMLCKGMQQKDIAKALDVSEAINTNACDINMTLYTDKNSKLKDNASFTD